MARELRGCGVVLTGWRARSLEAGAPRRAWSRESAARRALGLRHLSARAAPFNRTPHPASSRERFGKSRRGRLLGVRPPPAPRAGRAVRVLRASRSPSPPRTSPRAPRAPRPQSLGRPGLSGLGDLRLGEGVWLKGGCRRRSCFYSHKLKGTAVYSELRCLFFFLKYLKLKWRRRGRVPRWAPAAGPLPRAGSLLAIWVQGRRGGGTAGLGQVPASFSP